MALKGSSKGTSARKATKVAKKNAGDAIDWAAPKLDTAKKAARDTARDARGWAAPKIESAVGTVNTEVVPRVQTAIDNAGPVFEEAKSRGVRAVAALRGADVPPPPKKRHRVRKTLLFMLGATVIGGVAVVIWSRRNANGFDYYSLPADDFGRSEQPVNGSASRSGGNSSADKAESDPGQPAIPNTDPEETGKHRADG